MHSSEATRPDDNGRPTQARQMLGRLLRALREAKGITRDAAAQHLLRDPATMSRLELGQISIKDGDLDALLTLYGVSDTRERGALLALNARLNETKGWPASRHDLASWYCSYLVLESVARYIFTYETRFIPGLLQTREYAEATIRLRYNDDARVHRRVDLRMHRQIGVLKRRTPHLWAVIDKAALEDGLDNPALMRRQIQFLIEAARLPNVTIQVIKRGAFAARNNSFSTLRLNGSLLAEVVYLEHFDDARFIDDPAKSDPIRIAWAEISVAACKPHETRGILEEALDRLH